MHTLRLRFQAGDFQDILMPYRADWARIRFAIDRFAGSGVAVLLRRDLGHLLVLEWHSF